MNVSVTSSHFLGAVSMLKRLKRLRVKDFDGFMTFALMM